MSEKMKLHSVDSGFARIYYTTKNNNDEKLLYCLQDEGNEIVLLRCSQDGEPDYPVKLKTKASEKLEIPKEDGTRWVSKMVNWIKNN